MSLLFLSHSSRDNARALALRDWLASEGWTEIFLDIDPERGIVAGEKWEQALYQAAGRCDTVLFLISRHWLGSEWCRRELHLAHRLNKRIVALLIEPIPVAELPPELTESWQVVSLAAVGEAPLWATEVLLDGQTVPVAFARDGLTRLRVGLHKAGLDPQSFAWPPADEPERPPYRGLKPLEAGDAGIFFGREAPIIELLGQLRGLSEGAPPRFLAILGASGAGKSSFLRAGVLPRLARDDRHYLPLPVIRPEQAVLSGANGLLASLRATATRLGLGWEAARLPQALAEGAEALAPLLAELAAAAAVPDWDGGAAKPPLLVLAIDQGEELFQSEGQDEARRFLELLGGLLAADRPPLLALFTIRSDRYDALQSAPALQEVSQKTFSLPPMPKGAFRQVIEEPAKLLARQGRPLKIEPALTDALLQDLERGGGKDALPLLAFTLERLYRDYGADGDLKREEYDALGRIEGAIESAVDEALKAAQSNPRVPRDRAACLALLRRGLIPWMAGIDPQTNLPRRKVARLAQVPEEARPLIEHFIEHRLLATDRDDGNDTTIEPAHEALLRQWTTLKGWLEEDAAALATLESVQAASRDWEANTRDAKWLVHQTGRLEDAEALLQRDDLAASLDASDRAYLHACREQEDERRDKELRQAKALAEAQARTAKRTRIGLVVALGLGAVAVGLAIQSQRLAEAARITAANVLTDKALSHLDRGELEPAAAAAREAIDAWRDGANRPSLAAVKAREKAAYVTMTRVALPEGSFLPVHLLPSGSDSHEAVIDAAGHLLVFRMDGSDAQLFKPTYGVAKGLLRATRDAFWIVNSDGDVERCDASGCVVSGERGLQRISELDCQYGMCAAVADGKLSLFRADGSIVRLEDASLGAVWQALPMNATTVLTWHADYVLARWDFASASPDSGLTKLADATRFFSPLADGTVMSIGQNREILRLDLEGKQIARVARLPSPHRAAWGSSYGLAGQLEDGSLFGVSASGLKLVRGFADEALGIRLLPGARALMLVDRTAKVRLIDLDSGNEIAFWQLVDHDLQSASIDRFSGEVTVVSQQGEIAIARFGGYLREDGLPPLPADPVDPAPFMTVQVEPMVDTWFAEGDVPALSETARVIEASPVHDLLVVAENDEIQVRAGGTMARHSPPTAETLFDAGEATLWMGSERGLVEISLENGVTARRWRIGGVDYSGRLASPVALTGDHVLIEYSGRKLLLSRSARRLVELEPPGEFISSLDRVAELAIQGDMATLRTNSCKWLRYSVRTGARLAAATGECPRSRKDA